MSYSLWYSNFLYSLYSCKMVILTHLLFLILKIMLIIEKFRNSEIQKEEI